MYAAIATFQNKKNSNPYYTKATIETSKRFVMCEGGKKKQNLNRKLHLREQENKKNDEKKGSVFFFSKNSKKK